jgi:hypothetical protein
MRLLLRCLIASVVFSAAAVLVTALTFNGPLAMLGWPGIVLMDQVYSRFGIYVDNSKSLLLWLLPGFLIDVALYTVVIFVAAVLWRALFPKSETAPSVNKPSTNDKRPTTFL